MVRMLIQCGFHSDICASYAIICYVDKIVDPTLLVPVYIAVHRFDGTTSGLQLTAERLVGFG